MRWTSATSNTLEEKKERKKERKKEEEKKKECKKKKEKTYVWHYSVLPNLQVFFFFFVLFECTTYMIDTLVRIKL